MIIINTAIPIAFATDIGTATWKTSEAAALKGLANSKIRPMLNKTTNTPVTIPVITSGVLGFIRILM
ncbi:hypothetical protein SDC9_203425 [bioreactor metagenome]|uniref:Uncharacterized protein n=1 Tax=bioreactor metagenome TaxID=1076179 RepID=A0A645IWM3_9ZZZZ